MIERDHLAALRAYLSAFDADVLEDQVQVVRDRVDRIDGQPARLGAGSSRRMCWT